MFTALANRFRLYKLGAVDQFVMMYGGMRGGVAFALVLLIDDSTVPHARMFVTTTIAMVYWTSFVQGITIKPLVKLLGLKTSEEKNPTMNERIHGRVMDHLVAGLEGVLGELNLVLGGQGQRYLYNHIDHMYIKPWLLRDPKAKDQKIVETFEKRIQDDALKFIKQNATNFKHFEMAMTKKAIEADDHHGKVYGKMDNSYQLKSTGNITNGKEQVVIKIDAFESPSNSCRPSKDYADVDMKKLLSASLVKPTNRIRTYSSSRYSVQDLDITEPVEHLTFTRYQLKQAAQKMASGVEMDM